MKDKEKKVKLTEEEAKKEVQTEEKGVELTEEQLSKVSGGMWIIKEEFEESGATIVQRKCF